MLIVYSGKEKIDKNSCLTSLLIISAITLTPVVMNLLTLINISGVFKM